MHMEIHVDGKVFKVQRTSDNEKFEATKEFMEKVDRLLYLSVELDSGDTLLLPKEKIQRAIFLFRN